MKNIYKNVQRFNQDTSIGLTENLVKLRIKQGLLNIDSSIPSRSVSDIIKKNLFTLFNLINIILAVALLYTGSYKNLMFMGVVICNSAIGIAQEIRAKRIIDSLNLLNSNLVTVIRDGKEVQLKLEEVVLDDIVKYSSGNQIIADCIVSDGFCEVNESLLTGESDLVPKQKGDNLLSGSFVSSGQCFARVNRVGKDNYVSQILRGAKYIKKTPSEITSFLNNLIKIISLAIIPIGILLFLNQLKIFDNNLAPSITSTSAAIIGMIPEGLILLTSTALALGVIRLSNKKVLVQDIYCIETLARVDTLCLDKTGTITENTLNISKVIPQGNFSEAEISFALGMITNTLSDSNETFKALKDKFSGEKVPLTAEKIIPFSSSRKWSGAFFKGKGLYIIGASEFIFTESENKIRNIIKEYSKNYRVLVLAHSNECFVNDKLPDNIQLMAIILMKDKLRKNAKKTLEYFSDQSVNIKVISGDSPITVSAVSSEAGVKNADMYIDMSTINSTEELQDAANKYTIFGRVTPMQKKSLINAIKSQGHTVAMVGDGVNDVLALKEADCSISMANGSEAARTVSHITLLNSDFSSFPGIVSEGRRVINNIQRASSLFLTKTIYSCILSLLFLLIPAPYPFVPIQMTLISALTIGIPSFILALEPNSERISGSFDSNILKNSLPIALIIVFNVLASILISKYMGLNQVQYSTICVILTCILEIVLLYKISLPLNTRRKSLLISILSLFIISILFFQDIFSLCTLNLISFFTMCSLLVIDFVMIKFLFWNSNAN